MAQNDRAIEWTRNVLKRADLTPDAREHHEERLRTLTAGQPQAPSARPQKAAKSAPAPSPKPPRAAAKKAPATPPSGARRAAPSQPAQPAPSHADAYAAAHAHLHQGPARAPKPAPKPKPQPMHNADQLRTLATFHEREHRNAITRGDTRGAVAHAAKAAEMRKALEAHPEQAAASSGTGKNPEAERHMEEASHHRHLANRAGVARAAAAANVLEAQHEAEKIAADPNRGRQHPTYQMAQAQVAAHREKVAQHANVEKAHFADEKVSIAHAKQARAETDDARKRAENEALAAHARAEQSREAVRGGHARIGIAQIKAQEAAKPPEEKAPAQHGGRDPLRERRERLKHASEEFHALLHTGSHELIQQMHRQVGH
jgi:hypothetical protein